MFSGACPGIVKYWEEVISTINSGGQISLTQSVSLSLLGLVEELVPTVAGRTMHSLLLYYARKAITMSWKKVTPPSFAFLKHPVNVNLPLYKDTYVNWGCPKKYDKVWSKWLADATTASMLDKA